MSGLGRAACRGVTVARGLLLAAVVMAGAGAGAAVGPRVAIVSGGAVGAGGAARATSNPAAPRMAGTINTASGQSSLFMITRSVAGRGLVALAGHWELYPMRRRGGQLSSIARITCSRVSGR